MTRRTFLHAVPAAVAGCAACSNLIESALPAPALASPIPARTSG